MDVRWVERGDDPPGAADALTDAERARFARACERRRLEFATARLCAREALAALGRPGARVGTGTLGEPTWPAGVVGSIAHTTGLRAAATGHAAHYLGIGIDVEPDAPLPEGVGPYVLGEDERASLADGPPWGVHTDRLVFCVKEAVYKIFSPLLRTPLGFHDAAVDLHRDGTFRATLLVPGPVVAGRPRTVVDGRWSTRGGTLRVLGVLPRGTGPAPVP